jgi:hypothetical protein
MKHIAIWQYNIQEGVHLMNSRILHTLLTLFGFTLVLSFINIGTCQAQPPPGIPVISVSASRNTASSDDAGWDDISWTDFEVSSWHLKLKSWNHSYSPTSAGDNTNSEESMEISSGNGSNYGSSISYHVRSIFQINFLTSWYLPNASYCYHTYAYDSQGTRYDAYSGIFIFDWSS